MEIEIYLPCRPDIVCEGLELIFATLFVIGILVFIVVLYREHKQINKPLSKRKNPSKKRAHKP